MYQEKCEVGFYRFSNSEHLQTQQIRVDLLQKGYLWELAEAICLSYNCEMINVQVKKMKDDCFDLDTGHHKIIVEVI